MLRPLDETFLRRALRVAMNGRGYVEPNPMVGCVLVKNDQIIAEGHHAHFGGPHAEPNALADCQARGKDPRGATAYVTLEPCCHTNKKTPPCAPRLIEAGISRVVIGCLDPNPDVDGKGVAMLKKHGIEIDTTPPALAMQFLQLIAPFRTTGFYTTLKWAVTADGYVAGTGGKPMRITSPTADRVVHRLRTRSDAIAVGINTVLSDNPSLTVRDVEVIRRPIRIVLDRNFRMPLDARLLTSASRQVANQDVYVFVDGRAKRSNAQKSERVWNSGGEVIGVTGFADNPDAFRFSPALDRINTHLMIEPGPTLAASTLPWADRLWIFQSASMLAENHSAPKAAAVPDTYVETGRMTLGPDTLIEYFNRDAASFATATPSADFVLEAETAANG